MRSGPARFWIRFLPALFLSGFLIVQSGCESVGAGRPRTREIRAVIGRYQDALNQRSAEKLFSLLGESVAVDGMTDELSKAGLKAGMHWPPAAITRFQILSMRSKAGRTEAKVAFYYANTVLMMKLGFDESLRICTIDSLPMWKVPQAKVTKAFSSTFIAHNGLMFVQARINGRIGHFLVDTGSSGLLLNKKYFLPDSRNELPGLTSTVRGIKQRIGSCSVRSFQWGELRTGGIRGQLHDFSMMEAPAVTPLLGAIGYEQLKYSSIAFDWKSRRIMVRPSPDRTGRTVLPHTPKAVIHFSYFLHTPAFPVKIGDTTCRMIFDSGAQLNLIPNLDGVESRFRRIDAVTRISDGGGFGRETAPIGIIDDISLGGFHCDLPFAVFEVPYLDGQGILGSPVIQQAIVEIDFPRKTLSIW